VLLTAEPFIVSLQWNRKLPFTLFVLSNAARAVTCATGLVARPSRRLSGYLLLHCVSGCPLLPLRAHHLESSSQGCRWPTPAYRMQHIARSTAQHSQHRGWCQSTHSRMTGWPMPFVQHATMPLSTLCQRYPTAARAKTPLALWAQHGCTDQQPSLCGRQAAHTTNIPCPPPAHPPG
jgi:hypothetical protein